MHRLFSTHTIRKTREISSNLWTFHTLGEKKGPMREVLVPSSWQTYPETVRYVGRASYSRDVSCGGNIRFVFKGVAHTADVYFDGKQIAHHYNAFTEFDAIVRDVAPGVHRLEIIADNTLDERSALHVENDYFNYGGITRPVVMERLEEAYIRYIHFTPVNVEGRWEADIEAEVVNLSNVSARCTIRFAVEDLTDTGHVFRSISSYIEIPADDTSIMRLHMGSMDVNPWNPETPSLYTLRAELLDSDATPLDDLIDRIGFREVTVRDGRILINGGILQIHGFCRHEEHPQFGSSLPLAAMEQDILLMQDMGANSVRTTHYPNDELFLDLCDEYGILVWEENHARGLSEEQMRNPYFEGQAEACIREMIASHYNHPSIYIWGILNECASDTEYGEECYRKQFELIRDLDPSRPRSFASCKFKEDRCFGFPEIVSYNIYPLWYHNTDPKEYMDDLYRWIQEETEGVGKPFLITEIGAGAIYGNRSPMGTKWSEEYQADVLRKQLTAVLESDYCSGVYVWQFCDGKVSDDWWFGRPRTMNNKGIVDEYRRPKLAYQVVKEIFRGIQ